jgi:hypothetical protein
MDCRVKPGNDEKYVASATSNNFFPIHLSNSHAGWPVLFEAPGTP